MSMSANSHGSGIGVTEFICFIFIVLQLTHSINGPLLWVIGPFWMGVALVFGFAVAIVLIIRIVKAIAD